jgi:hypothetical protein
LDVYQSHDKSFIKRIIPINRANPPPYEQPLMYQSIPAVPPPPGELAISGKKMAMSPPQGKKDCAKAPPLGKQIGSISPPPGSNIDCLVHVDLHVIILCLWTIYNMQSTKKKFYNKDKNAFILMQH